MENQPGREFEAQPAEREAEMQQLLLDSRAETQNDYTLPRLPRIPQRTGPSPKPLWLTQAEAELLVSLCIASTTDGGREEEELFAKLGRFVRSLSL
jgi:hypothetical protein